MHFDLHPVILTSKGATHARNPYSLTWYLGGGGGGGGRPNHTFTHSRVDGEEAQFTNEEMNYQTSLRLGNKFLDPWRMPSSVCNKRVVGGSVILDLLPAPGSGIPIGSCYQSTMYCGQLLRLQECMWDGSVANTISIHPYRACTCNTICSYWYFHHIFFLKCSQPE